MKAPIEVNAWRAVAAAGVILPDELEAMHRRTERIEAELAELEALGSVNVRNPEEAIVAGAAVEEAVAEYRAKIAQRDDLAAKRNAAGAASRLSADLTAKWIGANRDRLIVDHLRPVVAQIMADAVKLVPKLEQFGPDYDGAAVAATSTPSVLAAWRDSRVLNERLRLCIDAWASSWNAATLSVPSGVMAPGYLRIDEPGGIHVWAHPDAVPDVDVRLGRVLEVLRVAPWHQAGGYRLAAIAEVVAYNQQWQLETPWIEGEFTPRQVLVPTGKPVPRPPVLGATWATSV